MRYAAAVDAAIVAAFLLARADGVPAPVRMLAAAALVAVLPGLGWLGAFRPGLDLPRLALAVVGVSAIAAVVGLAIGVLTGVPPAPWALAIWVFAAANVGLVVAGPPAPLDGETRWGVLAAVAAVAFAVFSSAALWLVPPLEDHDMEVRGTAWGLVTEGKPYFMTNREIFLPMAHPILEHVLVAESLVATGDVAATRPSYDSAKRAEAAREQGRVFDGMAAWKADYDELLRRPALAGARAPVVLLSVLVVVLLADLVTRLSGSLGAGLAGAGVWLAFPETIVRSAYAGYFSPAVFAMLVAACLFSGRREHLPRWLAGAGALMALVDHKTIVFAMPVAGWFLLRSIRRPLRTDRRAVALALGFGIATLAWWSYGFAVDARSFVQDHLRMHFAHRLLLDDWRLLPGGDRYAPSMLELWRDFSANTGWLFLPVALVAAVLALKRKDDDRFPVLGVWALVHMVAFTLTNWRQTKHLMNGLAPLVALAVVAAWPLARPRALRNLAAAALAVALLVNVATDVRLVRDFRSLTIRGASDVDGW